MSRSPRIAALALAALLVAGGALGARSVEPGVRVSAVELATAEGHRLAALRFEPEPAGAGRAPTALLAHGVTASKETLFRLGEALAAQGFVALAVDFPGHGASAGPFARMVDLEAALEVGARAFAADAAPVGSGVPLTVVAGHSLGAAVLERAIGEGRLSPRLFIALGARVRPDARGTRTLLLVGAEDELVGPRELESVTSASARLVVAPACDHALEPWDPGLVEAACAEACAVAGLPTPRAVGRWRVRLAGLLAVGLGAVLLLALGSPRGPLGARAGALAGAAGAAVAILALGLGARTWVGADVVPGRFVRQAILAGVFWVVSVGAGRALGKVERFRASPATAGQLALAAIVACGAGAAAGAGLAFHALLGGIFAGLLVAASGTAWLVARRTREPATAHVAFAVLVGYALGQWMPLG